MKAKIIVTLYIKNVTVALYTVNYNESTLSMSVNAAWNSVVLTARRNECSEVPPRYRPIVIDDGIAYFEIGASLVVTVQYFASSMW